MTEEIINADGSRNWEANILLDNIKRLEQENKELKKFFDSAAKKNANLENKMKEYYDEYNELYWTTDQLVKDKTKLKQTLEEIRDYLNTLSSVDSDFPNTETYLRIQDTINEVLQ